MVAPELSFSERWSRSWNEIDRGLDNKALCTHCRPMMTIYNKLFVDIPCCDSDFMVVFIICCVYIWSTSQNIFCFPSFVFKFIRHPLPCISQHVIHSYQKKMKNTEEHWTLSDLKLSSLTVASTNQRKETYSCKSCLLWI